MPHGIRRQAPGLRREELATLAGISVDYLVRLEQGRASSPSPQVLGSLARALRLTNQERDHLYRLAEAAIPGSEDVPRHLTPSIQRIIDRLGDTPVGVFSASWDLLSFNPLWAALLGDPSDRSGTRANLVWRYFSEDQSRIIHSDAQRRAFSHDIVADVRQASGRYPADRDLASLIDALLSSSEAFTEIWNEATVAAHVSSRKTIDVPGIGLIDLDCDVLTVPDSDLRAVVYTAEPGSADAARLDLLRVAGLQSFAASSVS